MSICVLTCAGRVSTQASCMAIRSLPNGVSSSHPMTKQTVAGVNRIPRTLANSQHPCVLAQQPKLKQFCVRGTEQL